MHLFEIGSIDLVVSSSSQTELVSFVGDLRIQFLYEFFIPEEDFVLGEQDDSSEHILESGEIRRSGEDSSAGQTEFYFLFDISCNGAYDGLWRRSEGISDKPVRIDVLTYIVSLSPYGMDTVHHLPDEIHQLRERFRSGSADIRCLAIFFLSHCSSFRLDQLRMGKRKTAHKRDHQS